MKIDAFVYEIGSTTTLINAFDGLNTNTPTFLGQGEAKTSVLQGDVTIGLQEALNDLKRKLNVKTLSASETFATSSAAGGLKMSVHGLVYDMTVKAAREAALGAGANILYVTSGILGDIELETIKTKNLNIIMISGGVDYGEKKTALENAEKIAKLRLNIPVIYAGNIQNQKAIQKIFEDEMQSEFLTITKNVYPKIDTLEVEEARKIIQNVFEKHIIHAPGMEKVRDVVSEDIMPTPGAVMRASMLLQSEIGDLITFDVGGATTDLHSVCTNSKDVEKILISPEPFAKRSVEGDLGVYINKDNLIALIGQNKLKMELKLTNEMYGEILQNYKPIPTGIQTEFVSRLAQEAISTALERHAGKFIQLYGASGKTTIAEGKDLTNVRYLIGTGGALTRLPHGVEIIQSIYLKPNDQLLKPNKDAKILIDLDYIMASCGVLSLKYEKSALTLLKNSLLKE
jgi:uncharacterized protein (TIGR01319 family)